MTLPVFPLSYDDFARLLLIKNFEWKLEFLQEVSGLPQSQIVRDMGSPFWRARVELDHMSHQEASAIQALIESFDGGLGTFYFFDPRSPFPAADPKGAVLGASTVQIAATHANNKWVKLKGLKPQYKLTRGDFFDRAFGSNPVHRGYHRIASAEVVADGLGNTDWIEFRPHFFPGSAAVNDVITILEPGALCQMVAKSFSPGQSRGERNYGMSFEIRQVV